MTDDPKRWNIKARWEEIRAKIREKKKKKKKYFTTWVPERFFLLWEICWLKQRMLFNCVVIVCWCPCGWDCCRCGCRYGAWGSTSLLFCCRLCSCRNIRVPVCQGSFGCCSQNLIFWHIFGFTKSTIMWGLLFFPYLEHIQPKHNFM